MAGRAPAPVATVGVVRRQHPKSQDASREAQVETNRRNWDERVAGHLVAYDAGALADDPAALSSVVRQDAALLAPHLPGGSPRGLRLAHLQCHIGTDTISWARLGARVTGIDFSAEAISAARTLAARAGVDAAFVQATVEEAATLPGDRFDVVCTSIGVLPWLPDLDAWARTVRALLAPGGVFFLRETHPLVAALDDERTDLLVLARPYLAPPAPARYDDGFSYVGDAVLVNATTFEWQHPLSEVIGSLLRAGLGLVAFDEHDTVAWRAHPALVQEGDHWALPEGRERLPLEFSLVARG